MDKEPTFTINLDDEAELVTEALYALLEIKQEAFDKVNNFLAAENTKMPRFREEDFAIPQIKALIERLDNA